MIKLNQVEAVEVVRIVSEFPDVFPEELPGMPPDREIEFVIDLSLELLLYIRGHIEWMPTN